MAEEQVAKKSSTVVTILEAVAVQLSSSGPAVQDAVKSHYVDAEIKRRQKALIDGIELRKGMRSELNKLEKQSEKKLDWEGKLVVETYSSEQLKTKKETLEKLNKLEKALEKAFDSNDFQDLFNIAGKGGDKNSKPAEE